ncbi:MAG TPA: Grx4 family monothiol glutaredoxin [Bdellovibrionota bacterium]|nr:Grx4 family monothiol glutaredoxin [Bdellovibrionota bacterium]
MSREQEIWNEIDQKVKNTKILLFTKGSKEAPRCGFSAATIECFNNLGVPFETVDVLADPELRPVLQKYGNWPTTPQVYINGKFIGGCDIIRELHASGELKKLVDGAMAG